MPKINLYSEHDITWNYYVWWEPFCKDSWCQHPLSSRPSALKDLSNVSHCPAPAQVTHQLCLLRFFRWCFFFRNQTDFDLVNPQNDKLSALIRNFTHPSFNRSSWSSRTALFTSASPSGPPSSSRRPCRSFGCRSSNAASSNSSLILEIHWRILASRTVRLKEQWTELRTFCWILRKSIQSRCSMLFGFLNES